ncbi:PTS ascorbate transporter subunit IIA [Clostridium gelidum]|uniref:Ascorbate-specific PTS system EIIA component n=1 Tax=Clostridium gelidum TaxID=704125 RepID=A0ABM7SXJ1_9CLOT|nr:PTS ascorbate transporter subunit IIA [Clostridium gelidum]
MLSNLLNKEVIKINVKCMDWKDAIRKGSEILINKGFVEERYTEAILNNFEKFGPYMVIAPGMVLSHARPEEGVKKLSMSLMTLKDPIEFGSEMNDPVKLIITLAAVDSEAHMKVIKKLMELLMNAEDLNKLMNSEEVEEAIQMINKY